MNLSRRTFVRLLGWLSAVAMVPITVKSAVADLVRLRQVQSFRTPYFRYGTEEPVVLDDPVNAQNRIYHNDACRRLGISNDCSAEEYMLAQRNFIHNTPGEP